VWERDLAIEAAMIGSPGHRPAEEHFGFMHLRGFNEASWQNASKKGEGRSRESIQGQSLRRTSTHPLSRQQDRMQPQQV